MKLAYLNTGDKECFEREISRVAAGDQELALVFGHNAGPRASVAVPIGGFWIPLWGRPQYDAHNAHATLAAGELHVAAGPTSMACASSGGCLWLALLASHATWRRALTKICHFSTPEPLLLCGSYGPERTLRKEAVALIRGAHSGSEAAALDAALALVARLQLGLEAAIARCPGRSYAQRRQVFVRLQRVRSYIAANCHLEIDNALLAGIASFSPSYFIRAFRDAFDETPHAYLVRRRLQRARSMLSITPLGITEIAITSGFENRSAFARIFRKRFGTTAGAIRRSISGIEAIALPRESAIFAT